MGVFCLRAWELCLKQVRVALWGRDLWGGSSGVSFACPPTLSAPLTLFHHFSKENQSPPPAWTRNPKPLPKDERQQQELAPLYEEDPW